jgi:hypothetical protein
LIVRLDYYARGSQYYFRFFTNGLSLIDKMSSPPRGQSESSASQQSPIYAPAADDDWEDDDDMDFEDEDGTEYATGDEIYFAGSEDIEETEFYGNMIAQSQHRRLWQKLTCIEQMPTKGSDQS